MKNRFIFIILLVLIFFSFTTIVIKQKMTIDEIFEFLFQKYKNDNDTIEKLIIIAEYILEMKKTILDLQAKNEILLGQIENDRKIIKELQEQIEIYKKQLDKNNILLNDLKNYINKNYFFNYSFFITTVFDFNKVYLNFIFFNYFTIMGFGINYDFINKQFNPLFTIGIRLNF